MNVDETSADNNNNNNNKIYIYNKISKKGKNQRKGDDGGTKKIGKGEIFFQRK